MGGINGRALTSVRKIDGRGDENNDQVEKNKSALLIIW